jgi:hypothetical protein
MLRSSILAIFYARIVNKVEEPQEICPEVRGRHLK